MMDPLVRELTSTGYPSPVTCRVLREARQLYDRLVVTPVGSRELSWAYLADAVFDAHTDDPEYGYRLLADEARQAGGSGCDRAVWRICRDQQWWSAFGRRRGKNGKKDGPPAHDDKVERDFHADRANEPGLTDISEHPTAQGKLYLCAVKDVFSNRDRGLLDQRPDEVSPRRQRPYQRRCPAWGRGR
jgi:putative transposase